MANNQLISLETLGTVLIQIWAYIVKVAFADSFICVFESIISNGFNLFLLTDLVCIPSPLGPS